MTQPAGEIFDPADLACLPASHPDRQEFETHLQSADTGEQEKWRKLLAEAEPWRTALPQVTSPPGLEARLLQMAQHLPETGDSRPHPRAAFRHIKAIAACLLLAALLAVYFLRPRESPIIEIDPSLRQALTHWAVVTHTTPPTMEISSQDPATVEKALAAHSFPFPVSVLPPNDPTAATLLGGGTCMFGSAQGVFTRWSGSGTTYTLFEIDAHAAGMPARFYTTHDAPTDLWHDDFHYQVVLWPGMGAAQGKCTWALVMEKNGIPDPFSQTIY